MAGFAWVSLSLLASRGNAAKGVARSAIPPARARSERRVWHLGGGWGLAALAGAFPSLDARLGSKGAVPEPKGLIARLHDMAVMRKPVQQRRRHLGIPKHS